MAAVDCALGIHPALDHGEVAEVASATIAETSQILAFG
jgi:hypothetical protein